MNEVENMYRNAHVYPRVYGDITKETFENKVFNMADICNEAFTAEKQLKIENVILQNKKNYNKWVEYNINVYGEWVIRFVRTDKFAPYVALGKTRAEVLANVINYFWQDLTEAEKAEIKNILESEVRE